MPKPSTYNPDALAILASGPDLPLTWQVYRYAEGPARVRFVAPRKGGGPRKVDHFDAEALSALVALAPGAREALIAAQSPSAPSTDPERAQLLSEVSRLRAQLAEFAAGRPAVSKSAPSPESVATARANRDGYYAPPAPPAPASLTFRDAVRLLKAIPAKRATNPILTHVLCEPCGLAGNAGPAPSSPVVRLTVVGLGSGYQPSPALFARIVLPLPPGSELAGPVAIPAGALAAAIARCHGMPVLRFAGGPAVAGQPFTVGLDGATVPALDAADFPTVPTLPSADYDPSWIATAADLLPAVSDDDTRTGLNGVHVESCAAGLRFAATDGHRLHAATAPLHLADAAGIVGGLLSRAWVKLAASLPVLGCRVDGDGTIARGDGFVLGALRPEGEFPDFRQVIPSTEARTLTTGAADLRRTLTRAIEALGRAKGMPVRLTCNGTVRLSATGDGGAIDLPIDGAEYSGEPLTFALNARYALDALTLVGGDAVQLGIGDALSPVLVASARTDRLAVVMPQRIE